MTALIPAAFGAVLAILGWLARNQRYQKHAMHVAAATGLMGFLGSVRGLTGIVDLISGADVQRPAAVVSQSAIPEASGPVVAERWATCLATQCRAATDGLASSRPSS